MTKGDNNAERQWLMRLTSGNQEKKADQTDPDPQERKNAAAPGHGTRKGRGFNEVAGMEELKQLVTDGFINVLRNRERAKAYGITPPSILLYGPAGCGKTFFAEKMAEEVGVHFIKVAPDDLASTLVHGTQQKIGEMFRKAERKAPAIVFFDEFDAMVPQRSNDDRNYQNGETNEFLCMLNNASERGVYVLAATNHPERIDKAVLRTGRIDEMIYVGMPDEKARESQFRLALSKLPADKGIDCRRLAELTKGYNYSDIACIVKTAARKMFNESIKDKDAPCKDITQELLETTIAHKNPSVSSRDLREFERLREVFSPMDKGCGKTMGFHA